MPRHMRPESADPAHVALASSGLLPNLNPAVMQELRMVFASICQGTPAEAAAEFRKTQLPPGVLGSLAVQALRRVERSFNISKHSGILEAWGALPLPPNAINRGLTLLFDAGQVFVAREIVKRRRMTAEDWRACPQALEKLKACIEQDLRPGKDADYALAWFRLTKLPVEHFQGTLFVKSALNAISTLVSHYQHFHQQSPQERFGPIMQVLGPALHKDTFRAERGQLATSLQKSLSSLDAWISELRKRHAPLDEIQLPERARRELTQLFGNYSG